jgi:hypothetical protein
MSNQKWVIFDLDGTLSDHKHRYHHAKAKDWDKYHELMSQDPVNEVEKLILDMFVGYGMKVLILTAREEKHRFATQQWLGLNEIYYDELVMRPIGDFRPSHEFKTEVIWRSIDIGKMEVSCVFDDRPSVVEAVRKLGITCLQTQHAEEF